MNPLQPSPMFLNSDPTLSNDVEVLQTDVMRFFAILCLCLTAIFALVKTLPMSPPGDRPTIVEPTDLRTEAEVLQKQVATSTEKLAEIVDQIGNKQRIHADLQSKIADETQRLAKIQAKLEQVDGKLNRPLPQTQTSEDILSAENPPRQSARTGFTLRFASDEALQQLISRGRVFFYAIAGTKAWQLHLNEGKPAYSAAQFPRQIYEMQTATVPIEYSGVFHRQVAAFGRDSVTWGVTLPSQTRDAINRLINGRDGGDLVIMPNGEVVIN